MRLLSKVGIVFFLMSASLFAQPGVRMSADFLPLEVGNRWVYEVFSDAGQKIGDLEFGVQEHRIVGGRSFYLLTQFPFAQDGNLIKLVRYDRQERQYMRMADNEEGPLFLADGTRVEVLQADESGLPVKFVLHGDLADLTFQRGMGIVEARMHGGRDVQIAKLASLHTGERKAAEAKDGQDGVGSRTDGILPSWCVGIVPTHTETSPRQLPKPATASAQTEVHQPNQKPQAVTPMEGQKQHRQDG